MDGNDDTSVDALTTAFRTGDGLGTAPAGHDHAGADHHDHGPAGVSTSVRRFAHRGHDVRIETTYRITIDQRPLQGHVEVLASGAVHYHGFPQYAPASAVDVVRTVIDTVWDKPPVPDELADDPAPSGPGSAS